MMPGSELGSGWWACQDLNLGPHLYQAYSRDAFMLEEKRRPAHRCHAVDRGCPLETAHDPLVWHVDGTIRGSSAKALDRLMSASLAPALECPRRIAALNHVPGRAPAESAPRR